MAQLGEDVDPVTLEVLWSKFQGITEELGVQLARTGFSHNVKYRDDFSTGLFTWDGRLIAQGVYTPGHLGTLPPAMQTILEEYYPPEEWEPGDVVLTNDPYIASGHLPDFFLFDPIFYEDELAGFCTTTCHMQDVGGAVAESMATNVTELFQEGLQIPPIKLYEAGELNEAVVDIVSQNSRTPSTIVGDLRAQRNATRIGCERYLDVIEEYGLERVKRYEEEIIDRSERRMRESIGEIADGTYSATDTLDGFDEPKTIDVTITVNGDEMTVDFTGTADEVDWGINSTRNYTFAYTLLAVRSVVDPDTPQTHGTLYPVHMEAPENCLVNATRPAPVGSRHLIAPQITNAITTALHPAASDQVPAAGGAPMRLAIQFFPDDGTDEGKILSDGVWGGAGARPDRDGNPAVSLPQNVNNTPIEIIEVDYPIRIDAYELLPNTGGAGEFRGGNATVREYEFLDDARIQLLSERFLFGPPGLADGEDGATGGAVANPGTDEKHHPTSKELFDVDPHDEFQVFTVGGGGFGRPEDRDVDAVRSDLENSLVTEAAAEELYGFEED